MNDLIKIIKSLEDWGVLIDGITETVKYETRKQEGGILVAFVSTFSGLINRNLVGLFRGSFWREGG